MERGRATPPEVRVRRKQSPEKDRLLQLANKTHFIGGRFNSPERRPFMGMRAKEKCRSSLFASEHSLPDKLTQALKHLRPGALVHSASGSAPFRMKNKGAAVAADDVVYISAPDSHIPPRDVTTRSDPEKRRHHSVMVPVACCSSENRRDNALKDLDHIKSLYKSVPNVSTLEDNDPRFRPSRYSSRFGDEFEAASSSTRSPTDSGYRSTPRHIVDENPYALEEEDVDAESPGVSRKTTTVVQVNGPSPRAHRKVIRLQASKMDRICSANTNSTNLPFSTSDVVYVLQAGACRSYAHLVDVEIVPRLIEMLVDELRSFGGCIARLSHTSLKVTLDDVNIAAKLIYPLETWLACMRVGANALSTYAGSGDEPLSKSMRERSGLRLPVGTIFRWLLDFFPAKPIAETVAVLVTAVLECVLEQMVLVLVDPPGVKRKNVMTVDEFESELGDHNSIANVLRFHHEKQEEELKFGTIEELTKVVTDIRKKQLQVEKKETPIRLIYQISAKGVAALHYYVTHPHYYRATNLSEWVKQVFAFAEHRRGAIVEEHDVQQAARLIIQVECPPSHRQLWHDSVVADSTSDEALTTFAFSLFATGKQENAQLAINLLKEKVHCTNSFGLSLPSLCAIKGDRETLKMLVSYGCSVNSGIQEKGALSDFTGWTPLTWAVAYQRIDCIDLLLSCGAELHNESMIKESPLQVAVQQRNIPMVERLLSYGADPACTSSVYEPSTSRQPIGCPSAIALAAARGDSQMIETIINNIVSGIQQPSQRKRRIHCSDLSMSTQFALNEALYYATECGRRETISLLMEKIPGLSLTLYTWTRAIQMASEENNDEGLAKLFANFSPKLAAQISERNIDYTLSALFSIVRNESRKTDSTAAGACFAISRLWHYFSSAKDEIQQQPIGGTKSPRPSVIDASFVNNENLSDVRFQVDGETIYGHRIVLINLSEQFRSLLQSSKGVINITDVSYSQFIAMMKFAYTGETPDLEVRGLIALYSTADLYGLKQLQVVIEHALSTGLDVDVIGDVYQFAIVHTIPHLTANCERFVLQHFDTVLSNAKMCDLLAQHGDDNVCNNLAGRLKTAFLSTRSRQSAKA